MRSMVVFSAISVATLFLQAAPASAAFGPNLMVNGSFEVPAIVSGSALPPYGTCGAAVPFAGSGFTAQTNVDCWTQSAGPAGSVYADRTTAKGGHQSVVVQAPSNNFAWLAQAVPAGAGTYQMQFQATAENSPNPIAVNLWSISSGTITQTSSVMFGPASSVVNGTVVRVWEKFTINMTAPAGTDHLVACLCGIQNGSTRFDAVTLKLKS